MPVAQVGADDHGRADSTRAARNVHVTIDRLHAVGRQLYAITDGHVVGQPQSRADPRLAAVDRGLGTVGRDAYGIAAGDVRHVLAKRMLVERHVLAARVELAVVVVLGQHALVHVVDSGSARCRLQPGLDLVEPVAVRR